MPPCAADRPYILRLRPPTPPTSFGKVAESATEAKERVKREKISRDGAIDAARDKIAFSTIIVGGVTLVTVGGLELLFPGVLTAIVWTQPGAAIGSGFGLLAGKKALGAVSNGLKGLLGS